MRISTKILISLTFCMIATGLLSAQDAVFFGSNVSSGGAGVATLVRSNGAAAGSGGTSFSIALTSVAAGDLITGCVAWTGTTGQFTNMTDGTTTFSALTPVSDTNGDAAVMGYQLSASKSGSVTYTYNFGSTVTFVLLTVYEFHTTAGVWHTDGANQAGAHGTSAAATGNITTTGSTEAITFCNKLSNTAATASNPRVNGVTPAEASFSPLGTYSHYYTYLPTAPFTGGQGTLTYSTNTDWIANLGAFSAF